MSYRCCVCGKGRAIGCRVSHSMRHTKHAFRPNLQSARIIVNGLARKAKVCTSCLKAGKVRKA